MQCYHVPNCTATRLGILPCFISIRPATVTFWHWQKAVLSNLCYHFIRVWPSHCVVWSTADILTELVCVTVLRYETICSLDCDIEAYLLLDYNIIISSLFTIIPTEFHATNEWFVNQLSFNFLYSELHSRISLSRKMHGNIRDLLQLMQNMYTECLAHLNQSHTVLPFCTHILLHLYFRWLTFRNRASYI
jgi:hypothetical protein